MFCTTSETESEVGAVKSIWFKYTYMFRYIQCYVRQDLAVSMKLKIELSPPPTPVIFYITDLFILLTVPRRYFRFGSRCLLVLVLVSVLFSASVCLDVI